MKDESGETLSRVLNPVGAGEGDRVRITLRETVLLKSSFFLYFFPAMSLIIGSVLGYSLSTTYKRDPDLWAILGGLVFLGISFLLVFLFHGRMASKRDFFPEIQSIVRRADDHSPEESETEMLEAP